MSYMLNTPTVYRADPFYLEDTVVAFRRYFKGEYTIGDLINAVLCCNSDQRQDVIKQYTTMYGRDLIKDIKSKFSGSFEDCLLALFKTNSQYDAYCLHKAMKGIGTDEDVLIEILCSRRNDEIIEIKETFKEMYGKDLEKEIKSETSGFFKRFLVSLLQGCRAELTYDEIQQYLDYGDEGLIDYEIAAQDAEDLRRAGVGKFGTDESTFLQILNTRHELQLQATFEIYNEVNGHDIIDAMEKELSGNMKKGMIASAWCMVNSPDFFARFRLHKAMKGLGTDEATLIRVLVSTCEYELEDIKYAYELEYGRSLYDDVASETSGNLKLILLQIIGRERVETKRSSAQSKSQEKATKKKKTKKASKSGKKKKHGHKKSHGASSDSSSSSDEEEGGENAAEEWAEEWAEQLEDAVEEWKEEQEEQQEEENEEEQEEEEEEEPEEEEPAEDEPEEEEPEEEEPEEEEPEEEEDD